MNPTSNAESIQAFRFDATSPESKSGLVVLYTQVFGRPFPTSCGACYNDAWQKLLKYKRAVIENKIKTGEIIMTESRYKFKQGYPKGAGVAIRVNGVIELVTEKNLNDFLGELLLNSPYANIIEVVDVPLTKEKKSDSKELIQPTSLISNEQPSEGSESAENVSAKVSTSNGLEQPKQPTERRHVPLATDGLSKKRGRKPKSV